ncbi:MAG: Asp-tRNA(Asn)/Glu-tRNA(Gln) amidotransferase subunit GatB [Candidatus Pacebacteria bacterium]|nr:Asp-tRNA(Asn)/Glu-tRNA(Gln) amidotransferase subunit GatB [Candidatus Paceibacterota bacterium]
MSYTPTIGLEVHAELNTESKMFCGCTNQPHGSEPNSFICPVCMAHPGTLPVPNEQAIEMVLKFGQAVNATPAKFSEFDRKNYFYPDIPKAYQISQYAFPFLEGGKLKGVELTRVHLEEDTARSQHNKGTGSLVDFNRAGVPLMELVTEPVIHDSDTASAFAKELQLLLRTLGISKANMEKGEMRVEANISVSKDNTLGTKVEVKNLNSFKAVEGAINYEIKRQTEMLEAGKELAQETRGWDENKARTFSQRSKETAKDYRYFPDPDIPKIDVSNHTEFSTTRLSENTPVLPDIKRLNYKNLGLPSAAIETIISSEELDNYFANVASDETLSSEVIKLSANYLTSDIAALLNEKGLKLADLRPLYFVELMTMLVDDKIGSRVAKDLLAGLFGSSEGPLKIAMDRNLLQMSDGDSLQPVIDEIISENQSVVDEVRSGKEAAVQFLVGQGMKKTKGAANPGMLKKMFIESIK